jgi:hypothetical protein
MFGLNVRKQRLGAGSILKREETKIQNIFRVSMEKQVPESKPLALQLAWASISNLEGSANALGNVRSEQTQYKIQSISHTGPVGSHWMNGGGKL